MEQSVKDRVVAYFDQMSDDSPVQPAIDMMEDALGRDFTEAEFTNIFIILGDIGDDDYTPLWDYMDVLSMWDR